MQRHTHMHPYRCARTHTHKHTYAHPHASPLKATHNTTTINLMNNHCIITVNVDLCADWYTITGACRKKTYWQWWSCRILFSKEKHTVKMGIHHFDFISIIINSSEGGDLDISLPFWKQKGREALSLTLLNQLELIIIKVLIPCYVIWLDHSKCVYTHTHMHSHRHLHTRVQHTLHCILWILYTVGPPSRYSLLFIFRSGQITSVLHSLTNSSIFILPAESL